MKEELETIWLRLDRIDRSRRLNPAWARAVRLCDAAIVILGALLVLALFVALAVAEVTR